MGKMCLIIDIDGTIVHHHVDENGKGVDDQATRPVKLLPGTADKFNEWNFLGYKIIITTARNSELRELTERQLEEAGIKYDHLLMDVPSPRVVINDLKSDSDEPTAVAINLPRNKGIAGINF